MYMIKLASNNYERDRKKDEFVYLSTLESLKKPKKTYFKLPEFPDEEVVRLAAKLNDEFLEENKYYYCQKCQRNIEFQTSLACFLKCFHDYCSSCWFEISKTDDSNECPACNSKVDKVLISDQIFMPSVRLKLMEELPTNSQNICSLVKNYEQKIIGQNKLFCPFKMNGCQEFLALPLAYDFDMEDLNQFALHMIEEHNLHICGLCIFRDLSLPSQVMFYTEKEFIEHMQSVHLDPMSCLTRSCVEGYRHELCEICDRNTWFIDLKCLTKHCKLFHIECDICKKVYAESDEALMMHYRKDHAYCYYCKKPFALENYLRHLRFAHPKESLDYLKLNSKEGDQNDPLLKKFTLEEIEQLSRSGLASEVKWDPAFNDTEAYMMNFPSIDGKSREVAHPPSTSSLSNQSSYSMAFPTLSSGDGNPKMESSAGRTTSTSSVDKKTKKGKMVDWSQALMANKTSEQNMEEAYPSLAVVETPMPTMAADIEKPNQTKPNENKLDYSLMAKMSIGNEQFKFKMAKKDKKQPNKQINKTEMMPPEPKSLFDFPDLQPTISKQKPSETNQAKKSGLDEIDWSLGDLSRFNRPKTQSPTNPNGKTEDEKLAVKGKSLLEKNGMQPPPGPLSLEEFPGLIPTAGSTIINVNSNKIKKNYNKRVAANLPGEQNKGNASGGGSKKKDNKKSGFKK